jgi:hypothetical protein
MLDDPRDASKETKQTLPRGWSKEGIGARARYRDMRVALSLTTPAARAGRRGRELGHDDLRAHLRHEEPVRPHRRMIPLTR